MKDCLVVVGKLETRLVGWIFFSLQDWNFTINRLNKKESFKQIKDNCLNNNKK
jgi:hypothetical protein